MRQIKITINGAIIKDSYSTDPKLIKSVDFEEELEDLVPSITIECFKKIYETISPSQSQVVEVYTGETPTRIFYGNIIDIKNKGGYVIIEALMETEKLLRKKANRTYIVLG